MGATFVINKIDLKKMLTNVGMSEGSVDTLMLQLDKTHRHVNAVAFADMLIKAGVKQQDVVNVLRRIGIDDVTITDLFNTLDEEKISSSFGKVVELNVV